ncbi:MAG TPA: hypothetical protein VIE91_10495 [Methylophilaceae bacterium]|jgi:tetratricopeptide (TPR) repeat protein
MSLLIKALEKAEQGKGSSEKAAAAGDLSLELTPIGNDVGQNNEAGVTQQTHVSGNERQAEDKRQVSQQAAATMFAAKSGQANSSGSKKTLVVAGVSLLVLLLIGMQFYSYLQSLKQPELVIARPALPTPNKPVETVPAPNPVASSPAELKTAVPATPTTAEPSDTAAVSKSEKSDKALADTKQDIDEEPAAPRRSRSVKSQQLAFGEPVASSEAVKITRNNPSVGVNPSLLAAYQAFNAGNDVQAQGYYRQVLQSDVRNVDALLGMAAIASRQGRNNDAAGWYSKVLEVEPRNSIAQAALISASSQVDPIGSETRIKNLLTQQPDAAYLYAALGGLYSDQSRWAEAQQAYFQAYHFDASNAEYAFNLAISLDQLGKKALALQYYKQTLDLVTKSGAAGIDRGQLESRITQLQ